MPKLFAALSEKVLSLFASALVVLRGRPAVVRNYFCRTWTVFNRRIALPTGSAAMLRSFFRNDTVPTAELWFILLGFPHTKRSLDLLPEFWPRLMEHASTPAGRPKEILRGVLSKQHLADFALAKAHTRGPEQKTWVKICTLSGRFAKDQRAVPLLIWALKAAEPAVRDLAAETLLAFDRREIAPALVGYVRANLSRVPKERGDRSWSLSDLFEEIFSKLEKPKMFCQELVDFLIRVHKVSDLFDLDGAVVSCMSAHAERSPVLAGAACSLLEQGELDLAVRVLTLRYLKDLLPVERYVGLCMRCLVEPIDAEDGIGPHSIVLAELAELGPAAKDAVATLTVELLRTKDPIVRSQIKETLSAIGYAPLESEDEDKTSFAAPLRRRRRPARAKVLEYA